MKLTLFLVCLSISMSFAMTTNAQSTSLSFKATDQSIKEVLELIESQTDFHFFYNSKLVDINQVISVDIKDKDVFTTLDHIFKNSNIRYKIVGKDVILSVKGSKSDQDEKTVTGTVVDEAGEPIIGANIVEKGKANGTMSDLNGHFSIVVSSDAVLQISYIGFSLHEEAVKNKNVLQVIMKEDTQKLDEVVVVGYGSVDKKELTSAVTAVSSKDFLQGAFTSPLSMIDGKVSGVNVSNAAAADPNSSPNIQMRGASSIEAGNSPLVIIDGMPGADLRSVANQDIESITILKDGSAAAIYGSRAANGVILVQTKKGKAGKVSISYDGYIDHDMVANQPKVLSVDEFLAHERDVDFGHRVDWYDKLLNKSNLGQSHYLAVSGGSENLTFRASANYKKKDGLDIASSRKEYGVRMGFTAKTLEGLLEIQGNLSTRVINVDYGVFQQAVKLNPTHPLMDEKDPSKYSTLYGFDTYNPVGWLKDKEDGGDRQFSLADFKMKLNILPTLNTELSLARQGQEYFKRIYVNSNHKESIDNMRSGRGTLQEENYTDYTLEWIGNYFTTIDKHTIKLMAGYSYQEFNHRSFSSENANFPSDAMSYNNLEAGDWNMAAGRLGVSSLKEKEKTIGFPARLIYNYDDTYYLTASVRYEGNSKFGANHKWGWFPSVSAAWGISQEAFMQDISWLNDLKLRAGYGVTGNQDGLKPYKSLELYQPYGTYYNGGGTSTSFRITQNPNPDLKWESTAMFNIGVDFQLFNGRLGGTVEYYSKKTSDMLYDYAVPTPTYVYKKIAANVGDMSNKGIEVMLNLDVIRNKSFNWNTSINLSHNKNEITKLSNDLFSTSRVYVGDPWIRGASGVTSHVVEEGYPVGQFFMLKCNGIDENGKFIMEDVNKDGQISDDDRTYVGDSQPDLTFGWNNTFTWKNWDASFFLRGQIGGKLLNNPRAAYGNNTYVAGANAMKGDDLMLLRENSRVSSYYLENASFARLDNMSIGYTFNTKKIDWLDKARIYVAAQNLFVITSYSGLDPEVELFRGEASDTDAGLSPGIEPRNYMPKARSFTFGVNLSF